MITKFSGMGRFTYPWCSAGMRESSASTQFQKRGRLLPPQPTGDGDRSIGHHSQSSCLSVRVSLALFPGIQSEEWPRPTILVSLVSLNRNRNPPNAVFKDPDFNLTVFMDAEMNPGPP